MKSAKRVFFCLLYVISAVGIARFCHHQTQGFRLTKIEHNFCEGRQESGYEASSLNPAELNALLQQEFHYFNRGLQSFVFLSKDGKYVLKLFNNRYQRRIALCDFLTALPFCSPWAKRQKQTAQEKLLRTYASYRIASEELSQETGLLYVHLKKSSDLPAHITLIDRLQIAHRIDPNAFGFVIQHKVTLVYPTLLELIHGGRIEEAKQKIASLLDLFITRCHKGIADHDPLIRTNFGFFEGRPIALDLGPYSKDPTVCHPEVYRPEIRRITHSLKLWLQENHADLVPFLEQQLEDKLSS